jgi:hypothetical protein
MTKVSWPADVTGDIRLRDDGIYACFAKCGQVYISLAALADCEKHGWKEVERRGKLVLVERN